jgi:hypothetical protein
MQTDRLVQEVWAVHVMLADWGVKEIAVQFGKHQTDPGDFVCVIAKQGERQVPLTVGKLEQVSREDFWIKLRNWISDVAKKPPTEAEHAAREQQLAALYRATDAFRERETMHTYLRAHGISIGLLH